MYVEKIYGEIPLPAKIHGEFVCFIRGKRFVPAEPGNTSRKGEKTPLIVVQHPWRCLEGIQGIMRGLAGKTPEAKIPQNSTI